MSQKTYVPAIVDKANDMQRYFGRWQAKLAVQATTPQKAAALAGLVQCIATFLVEWHKPDVQP